MSDTRVLDGKRYVAEEYLHLANQSAARRGVQITELEQQAESLRAEIEQWRNIKAGDIPDNDAWKDVIKYAYADGGDGAMNIYSITSHYIAMRTEVESLRAELATWKAHSEVIRAELAARVRVEKQETWFWQGDEYDKLESLACPIIITPENMRALAAEKQRADALEVELAVKQLSIIALEQSDVDNLQRYLKVVAELKSARKPVPPVGKADELCDLCGTEHSDCAMAPNGKLVCPVYAARKPVPQEPAK